MPGVQHAFQAETPRIGDVQKRHLSRLVAEVASLCSRVEHKPRSYGPIWAALCSELCIISYHLIPMESYELAVDFLEQWRRSLDARAAVGSKGREWREGRYLFICSVLTQIGQQDELPQLLERRYDGRSPQELYDHELDEICRLVAQKKRLFLAKIASEYYSAC